MLPHDTNSPKFDPARNLRENALPHDTNSPKFGTLRNLARRRSALGAFRFRGS